MPTGKMRLTSTLVVLAALAGTIRGGAAGPQTGDAAPVATPTAARAVLDKYCATCHSDRTNAGGLSIQSLALNDIGGGGAKMEKIVRKLRAGVMPPKGSPRPDA